MLSFRACKCGLLIWEDGPGTWVHLTTGRLRCTWPQRAGMLAVPGSIWPARP